MLTLWSIFRSPLMLGCELTDLDEWTLGLITTPEVLALLKDSRNAREILNVCDTIAWQAEDEQGNTYLAVFNLGNLPAKREITLDKLGLSGEYTVHDLWGDQPDAVVSSGIVCSIDTHGAVLFKLTTNPNSPFLQNTTRKGGVFCSDQNRLIPIRSAAYSVQI